MIDLAPSGDRAIPLIPCLPAQVPEGLLSEVEKKNMIKYGPAVAKSPLPAPRGVVAAESEILLVNAA